MSRIWELRPAKTGFVLDCGTKQFSCFIGKAGRITAQQKKEGDEATPIGQWPVRCLYYRPDRIDKNHLPASMPFPVRALRADDGWCDDAGSAMYNYPVRLPFVKSHEKLWRTDGLYDLILPLGYNDAAPVAGKGSAIFLHCADENTHATKGCLALRHTDLLAAVQDITAPVSINI